MFQIPTKVPRQEAGLKVGNQPYGVLDCKTGCWISSALRF